MAIGGLPLLMSLVVAIATRFARPPSLYRLALAAVGVTALLALFFIFYAGDPASVTVEWLPGTGPMGLVTAPVEGSAAAPSGLYMVLVATGAAFFTLLGAASSDARSAPLRWATVLLALGAANIAFLTDHFLARYVALEMVALCVALAPLIEVGDSAGARLGWSAYLLLRVGDAGLLIAILLLSDASGTLYIAPALAAAEALDGARVGWVAAGFLLAAWVKMGGWPFHLWSQTGRALSLATQTWLYAILLPNLGTYLLYRVAPLLVLVESLRTAALWLGVGGAALAALGMWRQVDERTGLVYLGAAQGGLALFAAAAGLKPVVWLGILVLTPVRLLLFLAANAARRTDSATGHGVSACLFGLGGLVLVAFSLLTTWWVRVLSTVGGAVLLGAEAAVAMIGIWMARTVWHMFRSRLRVGGETPVHWTQWGTVGLLGGGLWVGGLALRQTWPAAVGYVDLPVLPSFLDLLRYVVTSPALLTVIVLAVTASWLQKRWKGWAFAGATDSIDGARNLEEGITRAAQTLRAVVEVGIAERIVALVVGAVVGGARVAWLVEHKGLDDLVSRATRAVVGGARVGYRVVEQEGLEGLLHRGVRAVLALSRTLQRWHTGRLRRNLLWVPISLVLAVLALVYAW